MIFGSNTRTDSIGVQDFSQTDLSQATSINSTASGIGKIVALVIIVVGGYLGYEMILQEKKLADILAPLIGKNQDNIAVSIATKIDGMLASVTGSDKDNTNVLPLETPSTTPSPAKSVEAKPAMPSQQTEESVAIAQPTVQPVEEYIPTTEVAAQPTFAQEGGFESNVHNPYLELGNGVDGEILPLGRVISPQEEEIWRSGLTHRFTYQRLKTVEDIINERLSGSEPLLEVALLNKKFWTRMTALIGLVRLGSFVSPELVSLAVAGARESLVANYFKRFVHDNTFYERYVLRYSLRFVNARARLTILTALLNTQDQWTSEYIGAAMSDPNPRIAAWAVNNAYRLENLNVVPSEYVEEQEGQTVIKESIPIDTTDPSS